MPSAAGSPTCGLLIFWNELWLGCGAGEGTRTPNHLFTRQVRYRLRHASGARRSYRALSGSGPSAGVPRVGWVNDPADLVTDALDRVRDGVTQLLDGLSAEDLAWQAAPGANPIGWLVWHLTRVQDDHLAGLTGAEQVWDAERAAALGAPYEVGEIGYGHSVEQVAALAVPDPGALLAYQRDVHDRSVAIVRDLGPGDWSRVVDDSYDPPVRLGVRLVSVINDTTQHLGQVGYVRGLLERSRPS